MSSPSGADTTFRMNLIGCEKDIMLDCNADLPTWQMRTVGSQRQRAEQWPRNLNGEYATIAELLSEPEQPFEWCNSLGRARRPGIDSKARSAR
jgi:hypothetical protein